MLSLKQIMLILTLVAMTQRGVGVFAAEEDVFVTEKIGQPELSDPEIVRNLVALDLVKTIFGKDKTPAKCRQRLSCDVTVTVNRLNHDCELTDEQKQKLTLAGRRDFVRFFERLETACEMLCGDDPTLRAKAEDEVRMLRRDATSGLLGPDSYFVKVAKSTLTEAQLEKFAIKVRDAAAARIMSDFENTLDLDVSQKESIDQFVRGNLPLLLSFSHNNALSDKQLYMQAAFHLSNVASTELKSHFNDHQWHELQPLMAVFRGYTEQRRRNEEIDPVLLDDGITVIFVDDIEEFR